MPRPAAFPTRFPWVIGHEITGEILAVGSGVTRLQHDDPITAYSYLYCGHCRWCLSQMEPLCENLAGFVGRDCDGGYAEYIRLPERFFIKLPERLDHRARTAEIGIVTDALATPYKVLRRGKVKAGETVAVFGAGGGLGIHMIMMARWVHARVIAIDVVAQKFAACRPAGAETVVDASREDVAQHCSSWPPDAALTWQRISFPRPRRCRWGLRRSLAAAGFSPRGGAGGSFAADARQWLMKELEFLGSRYVTRMEVIDALELVAREEISPLVTEKVGFEGAEALHQRIEAGMVTGRAALVKG